MEGHWLNRMAGAEDQSPSRIERLCSERGLRMTGQRRTIARVLTEAEDHPDVVEVYRRAHQIDPRISLSTVYRTVKLFEENGILERHEFAAGRRRYEEATREQQEERSRKENVEDEVRDAPNRPREHPSGEPQGSHSDLRDEE